MWFGRAGAYFSANPDAMEAMSDAAAEATPAGPAAEDNHGAALAGKDAAIAGLNDRVLRALHRWRTRGISWRDFRKRVSL